MNSFWNDSSFVLLVDNDTESVLSDVEDSSGFSVIALVWHTLVD